MAKGKDFYLKFYVNDFQNDTAVRDCSAIANGVYIHLICRLFLSNNKGRYYLNDACYKGKEKIFAEAKQNANATQKGTQLYTQIESACKCFAKTLVKQLPFFEDEVGLGLTELVANNVVYIEDGFLCQRRMIRDAEISAIRSFSGKKGVEKKKEMKENSGKKSVNFANDFAEAKVNAKDTQNCNYDYNYNSNYKEEGVLRNTGGGTGEENFGEEEKEKITEKEKKATEKLSTPWGQNFKNKWNSWKAYRKTQHGFEFKAMTGEQAAVEQLTKISGYDEKKAIEIIQNAMAAGWKNFYAETEKEKAQKNGSQNGVGKIPSLATNTQEEIDEYYSIKNLR